MSEINFDNTQFESLMSIGVSLHNAKDYQKALEYRTEAYSIAPDGSSEKGRAARDMSSDYDHLGMTALAESMADNGFRIHNDIVEEMEDNPSREALRERSVSAMYLGVSGLRQFIKSELNLQYGQINGNKPRDLMRLTWSDVNKANKQARGINRFIDQYKINAARRVSISESIVGSKLRGFRIGFEALILAFFSESPLLDTSNPNKDIFDRFETKYKAIGGAVMALQVNLLSVVAKEPKLRALKRANEAL